MKNVLHLPGDGTGLWGALEKAPPMWRAFPSHSLLGHGQSGAGLAVTSTKILVIQDDQYYNFKNAVLNVYMQAVKHMLGALL